MTQVVLSCDSDASHVSPTDLATAPSELLVGTAWHWPVPAPAVPSANGCRDQLLLVQPMVWKLPERGSLGWQFFISTELVLFELSSLLLGLMKPRGDCFPPREAALS